MTEYELTYTVTIIVEAEDAVSAQVVAEAMLSEIAIDYELDGYRY